MSSFPPLYVGLIAVWLAVGAFGLYESWLSYSFAPWIYLSGPSLGSIRVELPRPRVPIGARLDTRSGLVKLVESDLCLVRTRLGWLRGTSPARGSIRWEGEFATLEVRVAPGTVIGLAVWFVAFAALALSEPGGWSSGSVWALLVGAAPAALFWLSDVPRYRKRLALVVAELGSELESHGA